MDLIFSDLYARRWYIDISWNYIFVLSLCKTHTHTHTHIHTYV